MALTVPTTRGSSAARKPTRGIIKNAGVEVFGSIILHKRVQIPIKTLPANLLVDGIAEFFPSSNLAREATQFCRPYQPINRYPGHHFRMDKVPARTAHLPDPFIRPLPACLQKFQHRRGYFVARVTRRSQSGLARQEKCVGHLAKNFQLILLVSAIAGSDRGRFFVSRQPRQFQFREPAFAP